MVGPIKDRIASVDFEKALTPFSSVETKRLRRYALKTAELRNMTFVQTRPKKLNMSYDAEKGFTYEIVPEYSSEVVSAALPPIRLLSSTGNNIAFKNIIAMLRAHLRETEAGKALAATLDHIETNTMAAFSQGIGIGFTLESTDAHGAQVSRQQTTREVFEDWLNGEYMHDNEARIERLENLRDIGAHWFTFIVVAWEFAIRACAFGPLVVEPILDVESLHESS